jgi:hypothetical protein
MAVDAGGGSAAGSAIAPVATSNDARRPLRVHRAAPGRAAADSPR